MQRHSLLVDSPLQQFVAEQRQYMAALQGHFAPPPVNPLPVLPAEEIKAGECSLRLIRPEGPVRGVFMHIHGGGFTQGCAAMTDPANSALATELQVAVVGVDYRLAPEYPHPVPIDDCTAAALWLIEHSRSQFGTDVLLLGGDSVGASLAVLLLLRLRDLHGITGSFRAASLVVGAYDFSMTPSQRLATEAHFLSPRRLAEMRAAAFPGRSLDELRDPAISALYARLNDLPPAIFTVGTSDAVLDDSLFMASRWRADGNEARLEVYPEAPHLFMTYPTRMAAEAERRIATFFREKINLDA